MYATSVRNMRGCCVCCLYDNLVVKGLALSADCPDHIKLFRRYVSRKAAGKARAVLEGVGLETSTIDACFSAHPLNDEEIVQAGLVKWRDGQGNKQPPTWEVLISAMCDKQVQTIWGMCVTYGLHISEYMPRTYLCGSVLYLLSCQLAHPHSACPVLCSFHRRTMN